MNPDTGEVPEYAHEEDIPDGQIKLPSPGDPKTWWLIAEDDVRAIRAALEQHARNTENEPRTELLGAALHALDSGLHTTAAVPADFRAEDGVDSEGRPEIDWGNRMQVASLLLDTLGEESPMPYAELAMLGILYPLASGGAWIIGPPLGHIQEALRVKIAEFDLLVRVQDFLADLSPSERSALDMAPAQSS